VPLDTDFAIRLRQPKGFNVSGSIAETVGTQRLPARARIIRTVWLPVQAISHGAVEDLTLRTAGARNAMTFRAAEHMSRSALAAYNAATVAAHHLPLRAGNWGSLGITYFPSIRVGSSEDRSNEHANRDEFPSCESQ
jgi:hypothetical protein